MTAETIHESECESYQADLEALRVEVARIRKECDTRTRQRDSLQDHLNAVRELLDNRTRQRNRAERERDRALAAIEMLRRHLDRMAAPT